MNGQNEIIEMARQAGLRRFGPLNIDPELEAFAKLIAAKERERVAQMFEDAPTLVEFAQNDKGGCLICGFTPKIAARSIRDLK